MKYYIGILKLQINCSFGTYLTKELNMEHFATVTEKVESIFQFPTTLQSTLGFKTLDKAAALGLETATPLTDPRQYINRC